MKILKNKQKLSEPTQDSGKQSLQQKANAEFKKCNLKMVGKSYDVLLVHAWPPSLLKMVAHKFVWDCGP